MCLPFAKNGFNSGHVCVCVCGSSFACTQYGSPFAVSIKIKETGFFPLSISLFLHFNRFQFMGINSLLVYVAWDISMNRWIDWVVISFGKLLCSVRLQRHMSLTAPLLYPTLVKEWLIFWLALCHNLWMWFLCVRVHKTAPITCQCFPLAQFFHW